MVKQLLKFGAAGVLNTLIDFGVFNLLVALTGITSGVKVGLINGIALILAATNSYIINRNWTFNNTQEKHGIQIKRFIIATLIGVLINSLLVTAVSALVTWIPVSVLLILNGGKILGAAASSTWNFLAYRNWVFKVSSPSLTFNKSYTPGLVSLIIPAYNETKRLPRRLVNLAVTLPEHFPVEILVVDDGSTDNTGDTIRKLADQYLFIRCLGYPDNRGKGEAVRTGMSAADGEFLIYTDADDTFTEEHISVVAEKLRQGADIAVACRQEVDGKRLAGESGLRHLLGKGFNLMVQFLFLPGFNDSQCGLKGFRRHAAQTVFPRQRLKRFAFDVELLTLAHAFNFNIIQVPVQAKDCAGSRVHCLRTPLQMAGELVKLKIALLTDSYKLPGHEWHLPKAGPAVALFLAALAVRIPWLWEVPRYIDELKEVNLAYLIYQGKVLPLHNTAHDIGPLHNYILAGIFKILGPGIYWPRLYVAIMAALTVVLVYYLGKQLYGKWAGLITAGLILTNGMHILTTHMAWSNCTTPFFFVIAIMITLQTEKNKSGKWLIAAAFMWALALQTHSSVIVYILAAALYVLSSSFRKHTGINYKWYLGAAGAFLLGYSNMIYYNLVSAGGSLKWLSTKGYALENSPGIFSYLHNVQQMYIELIRAMGSIYIDYGNSWQYLTNPLFIIISVLLVIGCWRAVKNGKALPFWMIAGGFAFIPWLNQRYVFYLATRYIMPLIICGILLIAYALTDIARVAFERRPAKKWAYIPAAGVFLLIITWQLVPIYSYCERLEGTNESNQAVLNVLSVTQQASQQENTMVLIDSDLSLENDPLPYIMDLSQQPYIVLNSGSAYKLSDTKVWQEILYRYKSRRLVAVMSDKTWQGLHTVISPNHIKKLTCKVTFPPEAIGQRTIYIVEMHGK